MKLRRLTFDALLTAIALTIFLVELQIPPLAPIPGVKMGLSNIVTVFAMFAMGPVDALLILLIRILLGGLLSGQTMAILYSFAGGMLCYLSMLLLRKILTVRQIWVSSVIAAAAHNVGQMAVALLVTRTPAILVYLPLLIITGMLAGLFTGLAAQFLTAKISKRIGR